MSKEIQVLGEKEIIFGLNGNNVLIVKSSDVDDGVATINDTRFANDINNNSDLSNWKVFYYDATSKIYYNLALNTLEDSASKREWVFSDNAGTTYITFTLTFETGAITNAVVIPA